VASSIPPLAAFQGNYKLGVVPTTFAEDIELSKDWYVTQKKNTPNLLDMAPMENMHIAVILLGQKQGQLIEGFVVHDEEGQKVFLEIIRPGQSDRRAELETKITKVAQGRIEYGAVEFTKGKDGLGIDAQEVDQLFLIHPYENIVGWQYISANGVLPRPHRSENSKILFHGIISENLALEYSFLEVQRGTIWRCGYDASIPTAPKGIVLNDYGNSHFGTEEPTAYSTMMGLAQAFSDQITQFSTSGHGVDFYVTDGKSLCMLAAFLDHCLADPLKFLGRPNVHVLPSLNGLYKIPEQHLGNSIESLHWLWHQTGFSSKYKERLITGNLFSGAFNR
jgi:hypothetical protein